MPKQINLGDTAVSAPNFATVAVGAGQTVNISNVAGATLSYFLNGINGAATTLAATNNANVTQPTWLTVPTGIATVILSGGQYG